MKEIDFLPKHYHERDVRRRATIWRYVVLLLFGGVLCAATLGQFALRQSVQASLNSHQKAYREAKQKNQQIAALHQEIAELEESAQLYTYLRHPWPRTQLLQTLAQHMPDTVTLLELQFSQRQNAAGVAVPGSAITLATGNEPSGSPAKQDLDSLRQQNDDALVTIHLTGTASDTAALKHYVGLLDKSHLFASASLASLRSMGERQREEFQVNIVVRPGYGQPGGPREPLVAFGSEPPREIRPAYE